MVIERKARLATETEIVRLMNHCQNFLDVQREGRRLAEVEKKRQGKKDDELHVISDMEMKNFHLLESIQAMIKGFAAALGVPEPCRPKP